MKLPSFSNALQILTNVGVIVSIVFLAVEINQNSALLELEQLQATTANRIAVYTQQTNADLAEILGRAYFPDAHTENPLRPSEEIMIEGFVFSYLEIVQSRFELYEKGLLSLEDWERDGSLIEPLLSAQWGKRWWREFKTTFYQPEFVEAVDRVIASSAESYVKKFESVRDSEK